MIRVPVPGLVHGRQTLSRETSHYVCRVLRLAVGDRFVAFDPSTRTESLATLIISAGASGAGASGVTAVVEADVPQPAEVIAQAPLALVYALSKGEKVDAVIRDATELGATAIVVAKTSRSIVKADEQRAATKLDRWRRIAEQAARQCGRADPPGIEGVLAWSDALVLAATGTEARFCLWESATTLLGATLPALVARGAPLAFAVGPEGGLTRDEVEEAARLGFETTSLGRFVLRTETVPAAVLGAVRVLSAT